jgi:Xaa-Pro aminopeptidase
LKIKDKLEALRKLMAEKHIDVYFVPSSDPHQSEYVADRWKSRKWLSGFTGSAGIVAVTRDDAGLWTDGRYDIQAENELKGSGILPYITNFPNAVTYYDWLRAKFNNAKELNIGFDGKVMSVSQTRDFEKNLKEYKIKFSTEDLIEKIWKDRPAAPCGKLFTHDKYAGRSLAEKIKMIRVKMALDKADHFIESSLDNIAWILNIRGRDILISPVVISHLVISKDKINYFVDKKKLDNSAMNYFSNNGVAVNDYESINSFIRSELDKKCSVMSDAARISKDVFDSIPDKAVKIEKNDPVPLMKSVKDKVEIRNFRKALIKDSVVLVKFQIWLEKNIGKKKITELDVSDYITDLRKKQAGYFADSFNTITAYKENAAMMHYAPVKETQAAVGNEGFLLVDTGGNYLEGTTDTTRTYALGKLSAEERKDYTLVLKGHINLVSTKFLKGTTGYALDVLARQPVWNGLYDYKCGTGHGVGSFLNVHEGPQNFSQRQSDVALEPGMITTVEPGVYKKGKHGIRIENMYLTKKYRETPSGEFYCHESLTLVPIDTKPIVRSLMNKSEIKWLNDYHAVVLKKLSPYLTKAEISWLEIKTAAIY